MRTLLQDLRYGARALRRNPGFTAVAVLVLALGTGANAAIFSVVNAVLLRPLPYPEPERLVQVWEQNLTRGWTRDTVSPLNFADWRSEARSFESLAAYEYESFIMTGGPQPERISGLLASAEFFKVLGVEPALGRGFLEGEDAKGAARVVVIGDGLWRRRFGAAEGALGQTLTLNGEPFTVVGVMPRGFEFPSRSTELWAPGLDLARPRSDHFMYSVGRLKRGTPLAQAQGEMTLVARRLSETYPDTNGNAGVALVPLHEEVTAKARPALLILLAAVVLMLLIACVNVANLLLARASSRRREMAVRAALGAGRLRIARQLLTESVLLSVVGGAAGLLLAAWGADLLATAATGVIPRAKEIGLDASVFAYALGATLLTGLLFGLAPAVYSWAPDLTRALKEGGRGAAGGPGRSRLQGALVVAEVALALVLLAGAGLLVMSYARLRGEDPGFDADGVLTTQVSLPEAKYPTRQQRLAFFEEALGRVRQLPGVEAAGAVSDLPFSHSRTSRSFDIDGRPAAEGESRNADYRVATPDYFRAMGVALLRGRDFDARDSADAQPAVVINEAMARRFFPGEDPLGRRLVYSDDGKEVAREVVGVVADLKHDNLAAEKAPEVYVPFAQRPPQGLFLAVRGGRDAGALAAPLRKAIREVDPDQPVYNVATMRQRIDGSVAPQRLNTVLLGLLAAAAAALSATGIFGVVSYAVARRTHEIGVRVALGAQARDVVRLVVGHGMRLAAAGVLLGLAGAFALTRLLSGLLYGVSATDPLVFGGAALLLSSVALFACYLPARRATRVDPMVALRYE